MKTQIKRKIPKRVQVRFATLNSIETLLDQIIDILTGEEVTSDGELE